MQQSFLKHIRVFHACMITTIGFLSLMYIESYTSPIQDDILERGILTINTYPLFVSAINIGGLIGSLIAGPISEWLGTKTSLIVFSQLGTIGGILLVWANDGVSMTFARGIIGVYSSFSLTCVPLYNIEVASKSSWKFYGGIQAMSIRMGVFLSYSLGIWLPYRWLAFVYLVMVVFMNLNLVFLPESPRWLRKKGWNEKAEKAREYFFDVTKENTALVPDDKPEEPDSAKDDNSPKLRISQKIRSYLVWPVIRPLLVSCTMASFKTFSSNEYLFTYAAHTLAEAVSINSRVAAVFYPISLVITAIIFLLIIHKVNWKKLLILATFIQAIANVLLSATFYFSVEMLRCTHETGSTICDVLLFAPMPLIMLYGFAYTIGLGSIYWWLYGKILHHHYIKISAGIVVFTYFASCILNQLIAPLIVEYLGAFVIFLIYAVLCFISIPIQCKY
ncbi:Sugar transporter ERD6-like 6 isoform X1 [Oopsacas minuta]|uniref:Sugar transporter ERD6-like 6 isoform X1 n=1 Tax=Oopsacas minuta TaxID=111878 RepID=A0AAV7JK40_9METZ|nr:Sugar transporter ERD6-like 6 isoform X1 [Oopsacas minuta]